MRRRTEVSPNPARRCATNSCDDNDYSNRDLTAEFYTKVRMGTRAVLVVIY